MPTATTRPPGPPGRLLTGHLSELRSDMLSFYLRCFREYGDCVRLRFGFTPVDIFFHPDAVEQILQGRHFTAGPVRLVLERVG
jgi:hypothetical protein